MGNFITMTIVRRGSRLRADLASASKCTQLYLRSFKYLAVKIHGRNRGLIQTDHCAKCAVGKGRQRVGHSGMCGRRRLREGEAGGGRKVREAWEWKRVRGRS